MVSVAQLVEPRIVIPVVVGSSPIVHPTFSAVCVLRCFVFMQKPFLYVTPSWLEVGHPYYGMMQHLSFVYDLRSDPEGFPRWVDCADGFALQVDADHELSVGQGLARGVLPLAWHRKGSTLLHSMGRGVRSGRWVLDATAGLGEDTFRLAYAGYSVLAVERNPALALLLHDAVARHRVAHPFLANVVVCCADAGYLMAHYPQAWPRPSVVYLDPMFEVPRVTAQKKAMRALSAWLGHQGDAAALLAPARALAQARVVVKRGRLLSPLADVLPDQSVVSRQGRVHVVMRPFVRDASGRLKRDLGGSSGASRFDLWLSG